MAIWDSLFGKKATIQFRDDAGNLVERKVSETQLKNLEASGDISITKAVEVHVLDPNGNYTTTWEVGTDISAEIVEKAKDPQSGVLYAITQYENGKARTHVCLKERWLTVKAIFDGIEQSGGDAMSATLKK